MKRNICLMVFFIGLLSFGYGQNNVDVMKREYGYDDAGNRIIRKVLEIKSPKQKSMDFQSDEGNTDEEKMFYVDKVGDISLKIFPNPTTSIVKLEIVGELVEIEGTVTLYNLSGAKIGSQRITSYRTEIDMSSYAIGTYMATVQINGKINYWKIVKQ